VAGAPVKLFAVLGAQRGDLGESSCVAVGRGQDLAALGIQHHAPVSHAGCRHAPHAIRGGAGPGDGLADSLAQQRPGAVDVDAKRDRVAGLAVESPGAEGRDDVRVVEPDQQAAAATAPEIQAHQVVLAHAAPPVRAAGSILPARAPRGETTLVSGPRCVVVAF
jgi:hypothetical protein